jgi:hypothetical protein
MDAWSAATAASCCASRAGWDIPGRRSGAHSPSRSIWPPGSRRRSRASGLRARGCTSPTATARAPPSDGEMLAFEPPSLMELRWGEDILRFELRPDGVDACVLTFSDTFDEVGRAARDGAGWHACLDLLGYEAAGEKAPWSSADRWRALRGDYMSASDPTRRRSDRRRGGSGRTARPAPRRAEALQPRGQWLGPDRRPAGRASFAQPLSATTDSQV